MYHLEAISLSPKTTLRLGKQMAPVVVIEYLNLACPDAKAYIEMADQILMPYVEAGQVVRYLKHFDKPKDALLKGNDLHRYISYAQPQQAYQDMQTIYQAQASWKALDPTAIATYANNLGLTLQPTAKERSEAILREVKAVGIAFIPTCFINEKAFVEDISQDGLTRAIQTALKIQKI